MSQGQQVQPGWYPDPQPGVPIGQQRWWDGQQWAAQTRIAPPQPGQPAPTWQPQPQQVRPQVIVAGPSRRPHGAGWWLMIGWWWAPLMWAGRVGLWLFLLPIGIWRSMVKSRKKQERATGKQIRKMGGG